MQCVYTQAQPRVVYQQLQVAYHPAERVVYKQRDYSDDYNEPVSILRAHIYDGLLSSFSRHWGGGYSIYQFIQVQ